MRRAEHYKIGDMVVLKSGLTRTAAADRRCRIVGILPNDHGHVQYRVRFDAETFERRIYEADINASEIASRVPRRSVGQRSQRRALAEVVAASRIGK